MEKDVFDIIKEYLIKNGYDGLATSDGCSCTIEQLPECGTIHQYEECHPAHARQVDEEDVGGIEGADEADKAKTRILKIVRWIVAGDYHCEDCRNRIGNKCTLFNSLQAVDFGEKTRYLRAEECLSSEFKGPTWK